MDKENSLLITVGDESGTIPKRIHNRTRLVVSRAINLDKRLSYEFDYEHIHEVLSKVHFWALKNRPFQVVKKYVREGHDLFIYFMPEGWKAELSGKKVKNEEWITVVHNIEEAVEKVSVLEFYEESEESGADFVFEYLMWVRKLLHQEVTRQRLEKMQATFFYKKEIWTNARKSRKSKPGTTTTDRRTGVSDKTNDAT